MHGNFGLIYQFSVLVNLQNVYTCHLFLLFYMLLFPKLRAYSCLQGSGIVQMKLPSIPNNFDVPILNFIALEHHNSVLLVQKIHKSLSILSKVMRGILLPSEQIQEMAKSLLNHQVIVIYYFL